MELDTKKLATLTQLVFKNNNGEALLEEWKKTYQRSLHTDNPYDTAYNVGVYEFIERIKDYLSLTQEDLDQQESPDQHPFD